MLSANAMKRLLINLLRRLASDQALAIVDLLVSDPIGWKRSEYRLTHERAHVELWVANHVYGLRLEQMCIRDPCYEKMSYIDRKLIWMHTRRFKWTDPKPTNIIRRITEAKASETN